MKSKPKGRILQGLKFPLKLVSAIFYQFFIFHQIFCFSQIFLQKLWKMFFISSKKLFRSGNIHFFVLLLSSLFFPVNHCFRGWSDKNLNVYDVINSLIKNLITHFVWYLEKKKRYDIETLSIDRVLNKERFYGKIMQKICTKKIFWKRIIKKPKVNFIFSLELNPQGIKNKSGLELVTSRSSGNETSWEKFLYLLYNIWPSWMM